MDYILKEKSVKCISSLRALKLKNDLIARGDKGHRIDCQRLCKLCMLFEHSLDAGSQDVNSLDVAELDELNETFKEVDHFIEQYAGRKRSRGMTSPTYLKKYVEEFAAVEELIDSMLRKKGIIDKTKSIRKDAIQELHATLTKLVTDTVHDILIDGDDVEEAFNELEDDVSKFVQTVDAYLVARKQPPLSTEQEQKGMETQIHSLSISIKHQRQSSSSLVSSSWMKSAIRDETLTDDQRSHRDRILQDLRRPDGELQVTEQLLGQGGFGRVVVGQWRNREVAVKIIHNPQAPLNLSQLTAVENEILLLSTLTDLGILPIYGYVLDPLQQLVKVIMEIAPYRSLGHILYDHHIATGSFPLTLCMAWFIDAINALEFIHAKYVKHLDIKAENFLVFPTLALKLSDFGFAKQQLLSSVMAPSSAQSHDGMIGTGPFMAPEIRVGGRATSASDIFSFAVMCIQILTRRVPLFPNPIGQLRTALQPYLISEGSDNASTMVPRLKECLMRCLKYDTSMSLEVLRPSANQVWLELQGMLTDAGGDPRKVTSNSEDRIHVQTLETKLLAKYQSAFLQHEETVPTKQQSNAEDAKDDGYSKIKENEGVASASSKEELHALESLNTEQAIMLLVKLGCPASLFDTWLRLNERVPITGKLLGHIETLEDLKELGVTGVTPLLRMILTELQTIKSRGGISTKWMTELTDMLEEHHQAQKKKDAEQRRLRQEKEAEEEKERVRKHAESEALKQQKAREEEALRKQREIETAKQKQAAEAAMRQQRESAAAAAAVLQQQQATESNRRKAMRSMERTLTSHGAYGIMQLIQLNHRSSSSNDDDGELLMSVSMDNTVHLWNITTGACESTLTQEEHNQWLSIRMTKLRDGRIVSGRSDSYRDHSMSLCTLTQQQQQQQQRAAVLLERSFTGHSAMICDIIELRSDSHNIVSGSSDTTLRLWNVATGQCERTFVGHTNAASCLVELHDGRIASGSCDNTIRLWNVRTGTCEKTLAAHTDAVCCLAQLRDGRLASGAQDQVIRLWNVATGQCERSLVGHQHIVYCLLELSDGRRLASGSYDKTIKLWNVLTGVCERTIAEHTNVVYCLVQLNDHRLASGSHDKTIRLWNV